MTPLSVVMPAYNEEDAIERAVEDVRAHVLAVVPAAELVVVDDGSRDRTPLLLDRIAARDERVRVIHQPNGGHGRALITGLDAATGDFVLLIDSDRQIPLDVFEPLWSVARRSDGVFGVRARRHDPAIRLLLAALIRRAVSWMFAVRVRDANVPFKILRRSIWLEARESIPPDTLAPSLFLALFVRWRGYDVPDHDVPHRARQTGEVSIHGWRLLRFCTRAFVQLAAFRWRLRRVPRP